MACINYVTRFRKRGGLGQLHVTVRCFYLNEFKREVLHTFLVEIVSLVQIYVLNNIVIEIVCDRE